MQRRPGFKPLAAVILLSSLFPASAWADGDEPRIAQPASGAPVWQGPPLRREEPEARNSTGNMVTGIILTSCGLVNGITGVGLGISTVTCDGEFCGFNAIGAVGFGVVGASLLAVGIPLWVVGAGEPDGDSEEARSMAPVVTVGPTTVGARWSF